jgi:hypothetical protein
LRVRSTLPANTTALPRITPSSSARGAARIHSSDPGTTLPRPGSRALAGCRAEQGIEVQQRIVEGVSDLETVSSVPATASDLGGDRAD